MFWRDLYHTNLPMGKSNKCKLQAVSIHIKSHDGFGNEVPTITDPYLDLEMKNFSFKTNKGMSVFHIRIL